MQVFQKVLDKSLNYQFDGRYKLDEILFFDIETTGFSPKTTVVYLIGCVYYSEGTFKTIQWFADDKYSEAKILEAFFQHLKKYKVLIHFNGDGFDIPYIQKKCIKYHLDFNFDHIESIDIYKKIKPYKKFLKLDNLKQKTIEHFLDIKREDKYSGGELIQIYGEYLKSKYHTNISNEELLHLLLLHNEEDIEGLLDVTNVLNYWNLFHNPLDVTSASLEENELILNIHFNCNLPKRISFGNEQCYFIAYGENGTLKIKLYKNELKFFYDNYKDYYYLPEEDTAIHKSIAFYVDKDFRTKAKAANCYSKKTGSFVPQYKEIITPYFRIDYFDKITYIETTKDFIENREQLNQYAKHILCNM